MRPFSAYRVGGEKLRQLRCVVKDLISTALSCHLYRTTQERQEALTQMRGSARRTLSRAWSNPDPGKRATGPLPLHPVHSLAPSWFPGQGGLDLQKVIVDEAPFAALGLDALIAWGSSLPPAHEAGRVATSCADSTCRWKACAVAATGGANAVRQRAY